MDATIAIVYTLLLVVAVLITLRVSGKNNHRKGFREGQIQARRAIHATFLTAKEQLEQLSDWDISHGYNSHESRAFFSGMLTARDSVQVPSMED